MERKATNKGKINLPSKHQVTATQGVGGRVMRGKRQKSSVQLLTSPADDVSPVSFLLPSSSRGFPLPRVPKASRTCTMAAHWLRDLLTCLFFTCPQDGRPYVLLVKGRLC